MKIKLFFLLIFLFFFSCDEKPDKSEPMVVYPIIQKIYRDRERTDYGEYEIGELPEGKTVHYDSKVDFYVVSNVPDDSRVVGDFLMEYNKRTLSQEDLKEFYEYERAFYKESRKTPIDFKESGGSPLDQDDIIESHDYDLLWSFVWLEHGETVLSKDHVAFLKELEK